MQQVRVSCTELLSCRRISLSPNVSFFQRLRFIYMMSADQQRRRGGFPFKTQRAWVGGVRGCKALHDKGQTWRPPIGKRRGLLLRGRHLYQQWVTAEGGEKRGEA